MKTDSPCDVHEVLRLLEPGLTGVYRCEKCGRVVLAQLLCYDMEPLRFALNAAVTATESKD